MSRSDLQSKTPEVTLDIFQKCECCSFANVAWQEFLERFADNLPESGSTVALRVHFKGHHGKREAARTDGRLRTILDVLASDRQVTVKKNVYTSIGLIVRACGSNH